MISVTSILLRPFVFRLPQINKTIKLLRVVYFQYELSKRGTDCLRMVEIYKGLQKIFPDLIYLADNVATDYILYVEYIICDVALLGRAC